MNCPNCNFQNPGNYRFCGHCGNSLNPKPEIEPEYRNLTVMFCDIVGSTALSRNLEPEDFHSLIKQYQEICRKIVESFGGYISQYLGDGVLIYFGFPVAKEDDPRRAVMVGLEIIKGIKQLKKFPLKVRIGINTGRVIIGDVGSKSKSAPIAIGDIPNTAAMIQKLGRENEVLIGDDTRLLVEGYFEHKRIRKSGLIVNNTELPLYRVISARNNLTRFQVNAAKGLSPFVGRQNELNRLNDELLKAVSGQRRIVSITGEAGIGKSRLIYEFKNSVDPNHHRLIECQCWEIRKNSPFAPIVELLERTMGFDEKDSNFIKIKKLEDSLTKYGFNLEQNIPIFTNLFSLHITKKYSMPIVTPEKIRQDLLNRLSELFLKIGNGKNLIFVIEDMHWADPSTLELLNYILKGATKSKVLIIISHRHGLENGLLHYERASHINLKHFNKTESKKLISFLYSGIRNESESIEEIISRSAGVPLFIEELTKASLGKDKVRNGGINNSFNSIPASINGYLEEKLDKLGNAKKVAQYASVIGIEFDLELLESIQTEENGSVKKALNVLINSDIIVKRVNSKNAKFGFRHALIRDVAYSQLSIRNRKSIHRKIAKFLENSSQFNSESQPELIALHYNSGDAYKKAIDHYYIAGLRDVRRPAYIEAQRHLETALKLAENYRDTQYKDKIILKIKMTLLQAVFMTNGIASKKTFILSGELYDLALKVGNPSDCLPAAQLLAYYYIGSGEYSKWSKISEKLLVWSKNSDEDTLLNSSAIIALPYFLTGKLQKAFKYWDYGLDLFQERNYRTTRGLVDPGLTCMGESSTALAISGFPDEAKIRIDHTVEIAKKRTEPIELPWSNTLSLIVYTIIGDTNEMLNKTIAVCNLCNERGIFFYRIYATIIRGYYMVYNGDFKNGIKLMRDNLYDKSNGIVLLPYYMSLLAEAYIFAQCYRDSITIIDESILHAIRTRFRFILPHLYRLKADSLRGLNENNLEEIQDLYRKSISSSRKMKLKLYELQATTALCRVLRDEGKSEEAYKMLSDVYGWFTEGFDTKYLREARELLDELGH